MARPKEFDRDAVLGKAAMVFWEKGYEATSTEDLVRAMGIGRQSMYDTFGDKHTLFLEALARYRDEQRAGLTACLNDDAAPLAAIESILTGVSAERPADRMRGCLMITATSELAAIDGDVARISSENALRCEDAFEAAVRRAQAKGEVSKKIEPKSAARFLFSTLLGIRLSAKAGATPEALRDVARFAMSTLSRR